jgi:hypothetical protein
LTTKEEEKAQATPAECNRATLVAAKIVASTHGHCLGFVTEDADTTSPQSNLHTSTATDVIVALSLTIEVGQEEKQRRKASRQKMAALICVIHLGGRLLFLLP